MTKLPFKFIPRGVSAIAVILLFLSLFLSACSSKKPSENRELRHTVYNLTKDFPEYDGEIIFKKAVVEDDAIVILSTLDEDFYGSAVARGLNEHWDDYEWKEEFKEKNIIRFSHLADIAAKARIDICWRFYAQKPGDGFDIRLDSKTIEGIKSDMESKKRMAEEAHTRLEQMVATLNSPLPQDLGNGISLTEISLTPNVLKYVHTVDESITSLKKAEDHIMMRNKSKMSAALNNGIAADSILMTAADADVDVVFIYKGSKTAFTQDYPLLTARELRNLKEGAW